MTEITTGFTLIELLIVIAIVGILAAVLVPNLLAARNKANDGASLAFLRHCVSSMEMKRSQEGRIVAAKSCDDPILEDAVQTNPSAIKKSIIYPDINQVDYTIEVISKTNKVFIYRNGAFLAGS